MALTRAFVAIGLPDDFARTLERIGAACPGARGVPEENMHLTLCFLGDCSDPDLEEVNDALSALRAPAFDLKIQGLGGFGGASPRAVWAGVASEPRLAALQKSIVGKMRGAGLTLAHRRFVPHVTIARFRPNSVESPEYGRFVARHAGLSLPAFPVRAVTLFASHLGRGGAIHEPLGDYPLAPRG